jgi:SAM-dependent methyltransferase
MIDGVTRRLRGLLQPRHDDFMPMTASSQRWRELLDGVAALLPAGTRSVLVDSPGPADSARGAERADIAEGATDDAPALFAARLTSHLTPGLAAAPAAAAAGLAAPAGPVTVVPGATHHRTAADTSTATSTGIGTGIGDVVIWLRTAPGSGAPDDRQEWRQREARADIVIDLHDPDWPVIRRVGGRLPADGSWYRKETRAFFACRAASWDAKFGDDLPAYAAAITTAGIARGGVALDLGCGTGRALRPLRQAVGPGGSVIGLDLTPEMLAAARPAAVAAGAALVVADARALPLADATADAVFAAGLVDHLPDPEAGLRELARVTRPGGLLLLFHPTGRATLAARHGRDLSPGDALAEDTLRRSAAAAGWRLTAYDDGADRFFARAERG